MKYELDWPTTAREKVKIPPKLGGGRPRLARVAIGIPDKIAVFFPGFWAPEATKIGSSGPNSPKIRRRVVLTILGQNRFFRISSTRFRTEKHAKIGILTGTPSIYFYPYEVIYIFGAILVDIWHKCGTYHRYITLYRSFLLKTILESHKNVCVGGSSGEN